MKKIKMLLDYKCYPMWVYNEQGELIKNDLIDELKGEKAIEELLNEVQSTYESLFIDNKIEFRYKGFADEVKKKEFLSQLAQVIQLIELKVGNSYKIENKVNFDEF
ncbi:hypothetical protein [Anaerosporomusa subterranea]|nr:hypothetical protein [Anaerosporomusa subterranea]